MTQKIVTLPLSPTDMVEFFQDKSQQYVVDSTETFPVMNERASLLYLANLQIVCAFTEVTDELMAEYIVLKETVNSPDLMGIHANILGFIKYNNIFYPELEAMFPVERMIKFAANHAEVLAEQLVFLDSFLLYALTRSDVMTKEDAGHVDDELHDSISMSLVSLLNFEDFMIIFSTDIPEVGEQTYYTRYWDDYMFRGNNMFKYAHTCPFFGLIDVTRSHSAGASGAAAN